MVLLGTVGRTISAILLYGLLLGLEMGLLLRMLLGKVLLLEKLLIAHLFLPLYGHKELLCPDEVGIILWDALIFHLLELLQHG